MFGFLKEWKKRINIAFSDTVIGCVSGYGYVYYMYSNKKYYLWVDDIEWDMRFLYTKRAFDSKKEAISFYAKTIDKYLENRAETTKKIDNIIEELER